MTVGYHADASALSWQRTLEFLGRHLRPDTVTHLEDGLLAAAGLDVDGPPESVLFSPGVRTRIGRPRRVRSP